MYRRLLYSLLITCVIQIPTIHASQEPRPKPSSTATAMSSGGSRHMESLAPSSQPIHLSETVARHNPVPGPITIRQAFPDLAITGKLYSPFQEQPEHCIELPEKPMLKALFNACVSVSPTYMYNQALYEPFMQKSYQLLAGASTVQTATAAPVSIKSYIDFSKSKGQGIRTIEDLIELTIEQLGRVADMPPANREHRTTVQENLVMSPEEHALLNDFIACNRDTLTILVPRAVAGYMDYTTIYAYRTASGEVELSVVDALLPSNGLPKKYISDTVVPVYKAITNPIARWTRALLQLAGQETPAAPAAPSAAPSAAQSAPPAPPAAPAAPVVHRAAQEPSLQEAARAGNEAPFKAWLRQDSHTRGNINAVDVYGRIALHEAILGGHEPLAQAIFTYADTNAYDGQGRTPLHCAAIVGNERITTWLLTPGAGTLINAPKRAHYRLRRALPMMLWGSGFDAEEDATPLHIAAARGHLAVVDLLLAQKKDIAVDQKDYRGRTALHCAAHGPLARLNHSNQSIEAYKKIVEHLLTSGKASINATDRESNTALHNAVEYSNAPLVAVLCERGAKVQLQNTEHKTPLTIATENGNREIVIQLLKHKANPNGGCYELHTAIRLGYAEIIDVLLDAQADANVKQGEFTPLALAVQSGNERIIRLLMQHGAKVDGIPQQGIDRHHWLQYPLHEAADAGDLERIKLLCEGRRQYKIIPAAYDQDRLTPLHRAAINGHASAIDILCAYAPVDKPSQVINPTPPPAQVLDLTPLHCAARFGHVNATKALLNHHAAINARDRGGLTPLHWSARHGHDSIVELLIRKGADLSITGNSGRTPLQTASARGAVIQKLVRKRATQLSEEQLRAEIRGMPEVLSAIAGSYISTEAIVQKHRVASANDDKPSEKYARHEDGEKLFNGLLEALYLPPSLSQDVPGDRSNLYCGYYALFNALSFLENKQATDRQAFAAFFQTSLDVIKGTQAEPPYDNLTTKQLRHLVRSMHNTVSAGATSSSAPSHNLAIAVLESNHLQSLSLSTNLDTVFEIARDCAGSEQDLVLIRDFMESEVATRIAIIFGAGNKSGHWVFVGAEKDAKGSISMYVADSLFSYQDLMYAEKLVVQAVAPCFFLLTQPDFSWRTLFERYLSMVVFDAKGTHTTDEESNRQLIDGLQEDSLSVLWIDALEERDLLQMKAEKFLECIARLQHALESLIVIPKTSETIILAGAARFNLHAQARIFDRMSKAFNKQLQATSSESSDGSATTITKAIEETKQLLTDSCGTITEAAIALTQGLVDQLTITMQEKLAALKESVFKILASIKEVFGDATKKRLYNVNLGVLTPVQLSFIMTHALPHTKELVGRLASPQKTQMAVLYYGDPGNGKKTLVRAIAQICNRPLYFLRVAALGNQYQFSRQAQFNELAKYLQTHRNTILLLNDVDAIGINKAYHDDGTTRTLLQLMDLVKARYPDVVFIVTTNCDIQEKPKEGEKVFPAVLKSRFDGNIVHIEAPDKKHREAIIDDMVNVLKAQHITVNITASKLNSLAGETDGFSIRDIEFIFMRAKQMLQAEQDAAIIDSKLGVAHVDTASGEQVAAAVTDAMIDRAYKAISEARKIKQHYLQEIFGFTEKAKPYAEVLWSIYRDIHNIKHAKESLKSARESHTEQIHRAKTFHQEQMDIARDHFGRQFDQSKKHY